MEWNRDVILLLIDEYEKYPVLWDPKHGLYHSKASRDECWSHISQVLECPVHELKKKMESLLASFRRERAKGTKTVGVGNASKEVYVSKWFACNKLAFLKDRDTSSKARRRTISVLDETNGNMYQAAVVDKAEPEIEAAQEDEHSEVSTPNPSTGHHRTSSVLARPKRKRPEKKGDARMDQVVKIMKGAVNKNAVIQDECASFGHYVANKLRNYDSRTRATVQHQINDVLFQADMDHFP